jgi:stage IV sporulation protein A
MLPEGHKVREELMNTIREFSKKTRKISDINQALCDECNIQKISFDAGNGTGEFEIPLSRDVYYNTLAELSGISINSDKELFGAVCSLAVAKREYDKVSEALADACEMGYGIVMPSRDELIISEPTLVKQGSGYGIKISASAKSIHMIKADIKADVCPVVGSEEQAEEVIKAMRAEFEEDPAKLFDSKMFGRSVYDLVNDGMSAKLLHLPHDARAKLGETLEKITNEGADGLICILL